MLKIARNKISTDNFTLAKLESAEDFGCTESFDCDDGELNDFFRNDAFAHKEELLTETYYLEPTKATKEELFLPVAFVSFLNDAIQLTKQEKGGSKKVFWKYLKKAIPRPKHFYSSYPAVKIGRLGVHKSYQRRHIGTSLLNMTKEFFVTENRTGCRFLTVDSYNKPNVINFYEKNGFQFLSDKDKTKESRIMYFDLKRYRNGIQ